MRVEDSSKQNLDPFFITGFVDAEGMFVVYVTERKNLPLGWEVQAQFKIHLHIKDSAILKEIQTFFWGGSVI